jgi:23S rRNA (pseudouridine1915-N3)-methyltransferase
VQIAICAIGRMKSGPEAEMVALYLQRARVSGRALGVTAVEIRESAESRLADVSARRNAEAADLLRLAGAGATTVALDESGEDISSKRLADCLARWRDGGAGRLAFLIGGPDGHGEAVAKAASLRIAFGRATWPHRLVRVMLAEQLYRAITILAGHPYHRD